MLSQLKNRTGVIIAGAAVVLLAVVVGAILLTAPSEDAAPAPHQFTTADEFATAWNQAAGWPDDNPLMHKLSLQLSSGCLAQKAGTTPQKIVANADGLWQGMTRRGSMTHDQFVGLLTASTELPC